nr:MAG TPA: hypothetical protein [Bacteriophage sp.]
MVEYRHGNGLDESSRTTRGRTARESSPINRQIVSGRSSNERKCKSK